MSQLQSATQTGAGIAINTSFIGEVEQVIQTGSAEKRAEILRRVTDLFLNDADRLSERQIALFDDVLVLLVTKIEFKLRVELSARLCLVEKAPIKLVRTLASDDQILVARPVLSYSARLGSADLIDIAKTKGQKHQLAMSVRQRLDAFVTDVLLDFGDTEVIGTLAGNAGANFSTAGMTKLVHHAARDKDLAEKVCRRIDVPAQIFEQLLVLATKTVRHRLLEQGQPANSDSALGLLATAAKEVGRDVSKPRDIAPTLLRLLQTQRAGGLNEAVLARFATTGQYEEMVVALGLLCATSLSVVEPLLRNLRSDGVLVPCKAANLGWTTVKVILQNRFRNHKAPDEDIERARSDYHKLSQSTAQRLLRFWQVKTTVTEAPGAEKRADPRRLTLQQAVIEIAQSGVLIDCVILDLAKGGACILVPDSKALPLTFRLRIVHMGATVPCSVAWIDNNRIGVSFLEATAAIRTATNISSVLATTRSRVGV